MQMEAGSAVACENFLTCGSSLCSRCGTSKVSTRTAEEVSCSGLLELREQPRARVHKQATGAGERERERERESGSPCASPLVYVVLIAPQLGFQALSPNPTWISSSLDFHPLKCVIARAHVRIVMARVLLLCPIVDNSL